MNTLLLCAVVQKGDYIGLQLLAPLDSQWTPEMELVFTLEHPSRILPHLALEVSADGYSWVSFYSRSC